MDNSGVGGCFLFPFRTGVSKSPFSSLSNYIQHRVIPLQLVLQDKYRMVLIRSQAGCYVLFFLSLLMIFCSKNPSGFILLHQVFFLPFYSLNEEGQRNVKGMSKECQSKG